MSGTPHCEISREALTAICLPVSSRVFLQWMMTTYSASLCPIEVEISKNYTFAYLKLCSLTELAFLQSHE